MNIINITYLLLVVTDLQPSTAPLLMWMNDKKCTVQYKQQNSRNMLTNKSCKTFNFIMSTFVHFRFRFWRWGYNPVQPGSTRYNPVAPGTTRWHPTLEWAPAMTEDTVSSDQSQIWKTRVTVSLCGMKQASSTWGQLDGLKTLGGIRGTEFVIICVCIVLYQAERHPLFLCERIGCTTRHNKPSMPLSDARTTNFYWGGGRGLPMTVYMIYVWF